MWIHFLHNVGQEEKSCMNTKSYIYTNIYVGMYACSIYMCANVCIHTYAQIPQIFIRTDSAATWPEEYSRRQGKGYRKVLPQWILGTATWLTEPDLVCSVQLRVCSPTLSGRFITDGWNCLCKTGKLKETDKKRHVWVPWNVLQSMSFLCFSGNLCNEEGISSK